MKFKILLNFSNLEVEFKSKKNDITIFPMDIVVFIIGIICAAWIIAQF